MYTGEGHTDLVRVYREFDSRCGSEHDKLRMARRYEEAIYVPTPGAREEQVRVYRGLLEQSACLPEPDPVFSLLKSHFREFIKGQISHVNTTYERPGRFVDSLTGFTDYMARQDSRPAARRLEILKRRLDLADSVWAGVRTLFPGTRLEHLRELRESCAMLSKVAAIMRRRMPEDYHGLAQSALDGLANSLGALADKGLQWEAEVTRVLEEKDATGLIQNDKTAQGDTTATAVDFPDRYRFILEEELGVNLDEILQWHDDELRMTRGEMLEIASRMPAGAGPLLKDVKDIVDFLNRYAGPCDSPAEMFRRLRDYVDRAQQATRDYVRLSEEHCRVVPVPEQYRGHYPWGGYGGGCPRRRPLLGEVFLNDTNYRAITDGWIKINAVHECYPGHHVQFVRATSDPLPETVKIGARGVPLLEGACVRTERLMEFVFPEDPFYPLFVAYRRHHTATRIKADLYLRHFNRPINDVVQLYVDELGFDWGTARGQVKAQELMVGYFTTYYYGLKSIRDMQAEFGYDDKAFTEVIFSIPHVSLKTLKGFLSLSQEGRERFLTHFPSLLEY